MEKDRNQLFHTKDEVYSSFFDQSVEGVLIVNSEKKIRIDNPGSKKALGYSDSELINKNISDIISPADWQKLDSLLGEFLRKGEKISSHKTELALLRKDGSVINAEISVGNHIHSVEGPLFIIVFSDISEKKRYQEELRKSKELFYDTFRLNPAPSCISRLTDGQYSEVNESFLSLFEFEKEEIIGKTSTEMGLFRLCDAGEREILIDVLKKNRSIRNYEITLRSRTGKAIQVLFSAIIIQLNGEEHILSAMIDITLNKKAQKTLENINDILEQRIKQRTIELTEALEREKDINEKKSRFVTMASHEFRTPLATILTSAEILEKYTVASEEQRLSKHFSRIRSSVSNLTEILSEFIALEKIEKGKEEIKNIRFSVPVMINEGVKEMSERLKSGQNILHSHSGEEFIIQDRSKVYNTVLNLISNAVKYSPANSNINVTTVVTGGKARIIVKDQGIGIPEKDQENLFTLFFRAKNAGTIQGTGLGLCIVKNYVELIGGTVHFESKENEGSVFEVSFPSVSAAIANG